MRLWENGQRGLLVRKNEVSACHRKRRDLDYNLVNRTDHILLKAGGGKKYYGTRM